MSQKGRIFVLKKVRFTKLEKKKMVEELINDPKVVEKLKQYGSGR